MSARNLLPLAAALVRPVRRAVPATTREGVLARLALLYGWVRALRPRSPPPA